MGVTPLTRIIYVYVKLLDSYYLISVTYGLEGVQKLVNIGVKLQAPPVGIVTPLQIVLKTVGYIKSYQRSFRV